jgi:metal-responsive CopG/Arc/MetJ family transcriptional regulator
MIYISIMPTEKPKIILVMEENLLTRIDDFRFENRINSRSEAIRRLIEAGLAASITTKEKKTARLNALQGTISRARG